MQADCLIREANESFRGHSFWHAILEGKWREGGGAASCHIFSPARLSVGHENAQNAATAVKPNKLWPKVHGITT